MAPKIKIGAGRYQQTYDSRDEGGKRAGGGLLWNKLPSAPKFFKANTETLNKFNIIPFRITSKLHPEVMAGRMKIGDYDFVLDLWIHRKIGPDGVDVICPKNSYGKRCPICEERGKCYDNGQEEAAKDLKPTRRVWFNVQPMGREDAGELQVFEVSHYLFMKELSEEANSMANGNGVIPYADLEDGKVVAFRASEEKVGKQTSFKFKSFKFLDRDTEVGMDLVEKAISFDSLIDLMTPDQIEAVLFGNPMGQGEAPAGTQAAPETEEEPDSALQQAADNIGKEMDAPAAAAKATSTEKKAAPAAQGGDACPHGHKWGTADEHNQCGRCKLWDKCNAAGQA